MTGEFEQTGSYLVKGGFPYHGIKFDLSEESLFGLPMMSYVEDEQKAIVESVSRRVDLLKRYPRIILGQRSEREENEAAADSYQGHQYTWIGFDELQQWENLNAFNKLKATLRSGSAHIPHKRIRATGNPGGVGHQPIKSYFIDVCQEGTLYEDPEDKSTRMFVKSLVTDNKSGWIVTGKRQ